MKPLPNRHGNILYRRVDTLEIIDVQVEVLMVQAVDDFAFDGRFQFVKRDHLAQIATVVLLYPPLQGNIDDVIVPVTIWIVALAKRVPVFFLVVGFAVQSMRGGVLRVLPGGLRQRRASTRGFVPRGPGVRQGG